MRKFGVYEINTGDVFIEATVKVRVRNRYTLHSEESEDYLLDALYDGDIEVVEMSVDNFEVTDIQKEHDIYEDYEE